MHGPWLILARMLWLAIFVLTLVVFCANLLVGSYGLVTTILLVANTSVWFAVSLVLFWRKFADRAILLISLQLVLTTGFFIPHYPGTLVNYGVWWVPIDILALLAGIALIFAYTFPDGRFVPGFTRWLALGWIAVSLLPIPLLGAFSPWNWWLSPLYALVRIAFYGSLALALLYRYRWMSTPVQRQQIKWVVFASTIVRYVDGRTSFSGRAGEPPPEPTSNQMSGASGTKRAAANGSMINRSIGSASLSSALSGDFSTRLVSMASGTETRFPKR